MTQSIVEVIAKLLRLADSTRNSNVNEVNEALRKAHLLMKKHNIDMSRVDTSEAHKEKITLESEPLDSTYDYIKILARAAAKLFNCRTYWTRYGAGNHVMSFVGETTDVAICKSVFNWLQTKARASAKMHIGGTFGKDQRSFCDGFASGVYENAKKLHDQSILPATEDDKKFALIVADKSTAISTFLNNQGIHLSSVKKRKVSNNYSAIDKGFSEGKKVNLTGFRKSIQGN